MNFIIIIISVLLNALAQIFLKIGMKKFAPIDLQNNLLQTSIAIIINPYIK